MICSGLLILAKDIKNAMNINYPSREKVDFRLENFQVYVKHNCR